MRRVKTHHFLLAALLVAPFALADAPAEPGDVASTQDEVGEDQVGEELPTEVAPPPEKTSHGIGYRTGGAGYDERDALTAASRDYSLKVVYGHKGESDFVAGVSTSIADAQGKTIFEAEDAGPWLFVKLPPGKYKVAATLNGKTLEQTATVGGKLKQIAFYW